MTSNLQNIRKKCIFCNTVRASINRKSKYCDGCIDSLFCSKCLKNNIEIRPLFCCHSINKPNICIKCYKWNSNNNTNICQHCKI